MLHPVSKSIPLGVDDFGMLVDAQQNYSFVDKSLFIKEIIDDKSQVTLITRPRRWGKTLNLSMLEYFFAPEVLGVSTSGMFDRLAISQVDEGRYLPYQGQIPVIFLSFKDIKQENMSGVIDSMCCLFQEVFRKYEDIFLRSPQLTKYDKNRVIQYLNASPITLSEGMLQNALRILSALLYKHYQRKKVYILIDEYDAPLNHAYSFDYLNQLTVFMKNMLGAALKSNPCLQKGVMTGVLRISKDSMLSGLNNVEVHSVINTAYAMHFGFDDAEVGRLFNASGLEHEMEAIRDYYNGYRIGGQACYNPWSIMQCLKNAGALQPYWVNTADDRLLRDTLLQTTPIVKQQLQKLLYDPEYCVETPISDTIRFDEMVEDETTLWSLLLSTGYLTVRGCVGKPFDTNYAYLLQIPNREVKHLYVTIFRDWLLKRLTKPAYYLFIDDLVLGRVESFTHKLEQYLLTYGSYHDFTHESNYHTLMLGLLCSVMDYYWLYSNIEAGHGRSDMILVPRDTAAHPYAIIMEFKRDTDLEPSEKKALEALEQIDKRQYTAFILRHSNVEKVLKIGFIFNGKQVASGHRWETL